MTDAALPASADGLFQKWKQFLDGGTFTTATFLAGDRPDLVDPLQQRINQYVADQAFKVDETLIAGLADPAPPGAPAIPGYTVEDYLGGGGMGDVWQVRDPLDRRFALKLARGDRLSEAGRERFLEEARAMVRLDHPHVARIHHFDRHAGVPYFLMPVYPASLKQRLAEYQADPGKAVRLMAAVADGVGHLHAEGFVHRDLKPGNVLLDAAGRPAVSDLGLVKSVGDDPSAHGPAAAGSGGSETRPSGPRRSQTAVGAVLGTRAYMAPEQAAGLTQLANPKWDVWALGVMLHELLTGRLPRSSDAPERLLDPNEPDNLPPSSARPGLDPKLERVVRKCLARDERDRYADGREVAAALGAWGTRPRARTMGVGAVALVMLASVGWAAAVKWPRQPVGEAAGLAVDGTGVVQPTAGSPADLVPGSGLPRHYTWRLGKSVGSVREWPADRAFTVDTQRRAVVELLPPADRSGGVRASARVRMNDRRPREGRVGVYLGGVAVPTPGGTYQAMVEVGFCDDTGRGPVTPAPQPRTGRATLMARLVGTSPENTLPVLAGHTVAPAFDFPSPRPATGADEPFHDLTLELTPAGASASFDGRPVARAAVAELETALRVQAEALNVQLAGPIRLRPDGGAGVFALYASGSFTRLRIEAIPLGPGPGGE